ncbi:MAG: hypothetical protein BWK73_22980 [Thiothrix lacustris]|uniref:Uncharacterized protein n=1 Tax=Thiothrix lacustris TaxID=525917 RepID=A0A1Y1QMW3_9GAMM|nr:MAG: hypothetical protein BWK73_22980 [Thiothrix lacustris]
MTKVKPWCWQVAANGNGPDWLLLAHVTPDSVAAMAAALANTTLDGYRQCADTPYTLMDSPNAVTYLGNLAGNEPRNIWVYNLVEIQGDSIKVESGYGGRGDVNNQAETDFLLHLFALPNITLQSWQVLAGGEGYDYVVSAAGTDAGSFMAYLSPD